MNYQARPPRSVARQGGGSWGPGQVSGIVSRMKAIENAFASSGLAYSARGATEADRILGAGIPGGVR